MRNRNLGEYRVAKEDNYFAEHHEHTEMLIVPSSHTMGYGLSRRYPCSRAEQGSKSPGELRLESPRIKD